MLAWFNTVLAKNYPIAILYTSLGEIKIELYTDKAPLSANDFIRYIEKELYNNQGFYRIVREDNDQGNPRIDVVQGGLLDDKEGLPPVKHETTKTTKLTHKRGTISLARGAVGTGSAAYFFIVVNDSPGLDFGYSRNADKMGFSAFGKVIEGMDIIDKIHQIPSEKLSGEGYTKNQILEKPILISKSKMVTKVKTSN